MKNSAIKVKGKVIPVLNNHTIKTYLLN